MGRVVPLPPGNSVGRAQRLSTTAFVVSSNLSGTPGPAQAMPTDLVRASPR